MKNFLGLDPHPMDEFLHWTDELEDANDLRNKFDSFTPEEQTLVLYLMRQAYNKGGHDEYDSHNPDI